MVEALRYVVPIGVRVAGLAFCLLTSAYAVAAYSPFAFDMFLKPQLWPWLASFAAWHHASFLVFAGISIATVVPQAAGRQGNAGKWLASGYVIVVGSAALYLIWHPVLPTLANDGRSLVVALLALTPALWLAILDRIGQQDFRRPSPSSARTLLKSATLAAVCLATAHVTTAIAAHHIDVSTSTWLVIGVWSLTLTLSVLVIAAVILIAIGEAARATPQPELWRRVLTDTALTLGMATFLRRFVFPSIAIDGVVAWILSTAMAFTIVLTSAAATRQVQIEAAGESTPTRNRRQRLLTDGMVIAVTLTANFALRSAGSFDWNFVVQKFIVATEWTVVFVLCARLVREELPRRATLMAIALPPVAVFLAVHVVAAANTEGLDKYAANDMSFRLARDLMVKEPGFDSAYYTYLAHATDASATPTTLPDIEFTDPKSVPARTPDIFLFVIDSLRRDYLSAYNASVDFTPGLAAFAHESFVFRNSYSRYGGTLLAMPSIWAGGTVNRRWHADGFEPMNALEKLVSRDGYRVVINDYTVADTLRRDLPLTFLDPKVPSVQTDLCHLLHGLQAHLDGSRSDTRPVFTFLAPMNVHILNTRGDSQSGEARDSSLYAPYVTRLRNIDGCFADFVRYLKAAGRYDRSVIIITSDHGDLLGEQGRWGHQFWLSPSVVQVPLIIHLPHDIRPGVTPDLSRLTFSTDITPTLYELLGHEVRDLGPLFGQSIFQQPSRGVSYRPRDSVLLLASYGPIYGLLQRNGTFLYVSDMMNRHEEAYDTVTGEPVAITDAMRVANHREIVQQVREMTALFAARD
jgi:glucan phosphoethanolaminetransferase (alkaline phosphatase superfamily)